MNEWQEFQNASPEVKKEALRIFDAANFRFKILEKSHPQVMDINYVVQDIRFSDFMEKINLQ